MDGLSEKRLYVQLGLAKFIAIDSWLRRGHESACSPAFAVALTDALQWCILWPTGTFQSPPLVFIASFRILLSFFSISPPSFSQY